MRAIIVNGFCGSGKTTFINYLVSMMKPWNIVVLQNEFGDVKLDKSITSSEILACACCGPTRNDFLKYVNDLYNKYNPDILIIEANYTSSPAILKELLLSTGVIEDNIICYHIADACNFISHWKNFGNIYRGQVRESDIVVFAKYNLLKGNKNRYDNSKDYLNEIIHDENLNIKVHEIGQYIK